MKPWDNPWDVWWVMQLLKKNKKIEK